MPARLDDALPLGEVLWTHPDPTATPMWRFLERVNEKHGLRLKGYRDLYRWSVDDVALFWEEVWHFVGITASVPFDQVWNCCLDCLYAKKLLGYASDESRVRQTERLSGLGSAVAEQLHIVCVRLIELYTVASLK